MSDMSAKENVELMLQIFSAIERRDAERALELFDPDVEFHWPPSLPYGGTFRGLLPDHPTWSQTWDALQPTEAERTMDYRVIAASDDEVVVLWQQRGVAPTGERFDGPVLGLYKVREGKLVRAQMFYFDTVALVSFLEKANSAKPIRMAS
jgi:uncharacterized protein